MGLIRVTINDAIINLLNGFNDVKNTTNIEFFGDGDRKIYTYKRYDFSYVKGIYEDDEKLHVSYSKGKKRCFFQVYKREVDMLMKDAYGDIFVNDIDKRFINLFNDW